MAKIWLTYNLSVRVRGEEYLLKMGFARKALGHVTPK